MTRRPLVLLVLLPAFLAACGTNDTSGLPTVPTLDEQSAGTFAAVTVGRDHTCALDRSGHPYCWGSDADGQLGHPPSAMCDTGSRGGCSLSAEPVTTSLVFEQISAGARHTCAITAAGAAYCWGYAGDGALGNTPTMSAPGSPALTPQPVSGGLTFAWISAGYSHTCGVTADGTAYCWGRNDRGQLGTGDTLTRGTPTPVATTLHFTEISAGQQRTCGITVSNGVYCWGNIWLYRQHGFEYSRLQSTPEAVPGAMPFADLSVGTFTTCGVADQAAYCWEGNPHGEMGNGTTDGSITPALVSGDLAFTEISAGIIQTCGVTVDGEAYCWGNDSFGQLGVSPSTLSSRCAGATLACSEVPIRVIGWRHFVSVETGLGNHTCGVTTDANIYCWGLGQSGQLGYGGLVSATSQPLRVAIALP